VIEMAEEKAVDPVCGMSVDPKKTPYKSVYKGKIYYFCSKMCKEAFDRDPEGVLSGRVRILMSGSSNRLPCCDVI